MARTSLVSFEPQDNQPPAADFATLDLRNGHPVLDFDASVNEDAIFASVWPRHYAGNDVTVRVQWTSSSATTGDVVWLGAFENNADGGDDIDADSFATAQDGVGTAPAASGVLRYTDIAFTSAEIDGIGGGVHFRLRIRRNATDAGDTMAGDAEIRGIEIVEEVP